jgi:hypothetical protein
MGEPGLLDDHFIELRRKQNAWQQCSHFLESLQCFQAGKPGHVHVEQNQMDGLVFDDGEGLFSITGHQCLDSPWLECAAQRFPIGEVVIGNQDGWSFEVHDWYPYAEADELRCNWGAESRIFNRISKVIVRNSFAISILRHFI